MTLDLTQSRWELTGWRPLAWKYGRSVETTFWLEPEIGPVEGRLPGSVQENLRRAGLLADWNSGLNSCAVEWVEHRHWMFETDLPEMEAPPVFVAESLDYAGWILVNRRVAGTFCGPHRPVEVDLSSAWGDEPGPRRLAIVFGTPPELHGQVGYTSETQELKPRYSYGWDWCPRLIPAGARGAVGLVSPAEQAVRLVGLRTELEADLKTARVVVRVDLPAGCEVGISLGRAGLPGRDELLARPFPNPRTSGPLVPTLQESVNEFCFEVASPDLWWPNGAGEQALYDLKITVRGPGEGREDPPDRPLNPKRTTGSAFGELRRDKPVVPTKEREQDGIVAEWNRTIGFKHVAWQPCEGAPEGARPWICVVNGRPIFLQGVNWTPARLAYMDATREEIEELVGLYRDMGCNVLRVWGGASLESEEFYAACDRAGFLVWQEFPLSSSGLDSVPPRGPEVIEELRGVARHFIRARQHHASLLMWCGGNELQEGYEDGDWSKRHPCDESHPCLAAFAQVVAEEDPGRRFIPTSPCGPSFLGKRENFGTGVHHAVHGPWGLGDFRDLDDWRDYWTNDDALFRSEVGVAGAADVELLRRHAGGEELWPPTTLLWRHAANWWTQEQRLVAPFAHLPADEALAAYVEQTRREQAEALTMAARACKGRFPRCGGFIVWMGHDCFPCPANTSLVDFARRPKPAWRALREVFGAG